MSGTTSIANDCAQRRSPVKLHAQPTSFYNTVTAYAASSVDINEVRFESSILVLPQGPVIAWPLARFDELTAAHFEQILELQPEVVVFGSGSRLRFPDPRLFVGLTNRQIGVECMDLHAACRTYNILMSEGRKVAAALLIPSAGDRA